MGFFYFKVFLLVMYIDVFCWLIIRIGIYMILGRIMLSCLCLVEKSWNF